VIPFRVDFRPGVPIHERVVYAATKAIIAGQMRPGEPFPSVRLLSRTLKINPNTAHKVVGELVAAGLLERRPGIGTVVASVPEASSAERTQLLGEEIEHLVVEAKRLGISLAEMLGSISSHWARLGDGGARNSDREQRGKR
jgi:GntR family transcriptional regulator